jgi:hypothetical protein
MLTSTRANRLIVALVAAASLGTAACSPSTPAPPSEPNAPAPGQFPAESPYNNCHTSSCIYLADIDTTGRTVKFHGETRYFQENSQWFLTVHQGANVVATAESGNIASNRFDADLGALPAGGAYRLSILAGTPFGDQLMYKTFQTGPNVTATPTATNVKLAFTMPVPVTATAYIRKANGNLVATVTGSGSSAAQTLVSTATLDPTTSYTYQVMATDAQGRVYEKNGSFLTRNVRLEVELSELKITNDSDVAGAGELRAELYLGQTTDWIWENARSVDSGQTFTIDAAASLPTAVRSVPINVVVSDDDCPPVGPLCTAGLGHLSVGSGSVDGESEWATATYTATLPNTTITTSWTDFDASVAGPVGFRVSGSYRWVMV